jgi:DNA-binding SARP family transcriptional activator
LPHTEAGLRIRALGGFVVLRGGRPVQAAEWQSKKARDLLKILVAHRGRPMPREALIEHLWQDEEPAKLSGRLSVALSTLRSVLDPGRIPGADSLIIADRDHVRLATGTVPIDLEEFMSLAESGLALIHSGREAEGIDLLEVADAQYAGDFLEEDAYEDWAAPVREEARGLSIRVARELAKAAALRGDVGGATSYLLRILERDPYDEEAHLSLASTLDRFGGHGEARRAYGRYVARMQELGVEPASFPSTGSSG